jgi:hypothetical protein
MASLSRFVVPLALFACTSSSEPAPQDSCCPSGGCIGPMTECSSHWVPDELPTATGTVPATAPTANGSLAIEAPELTAEASTSSGASPKLVAYDATSLVVLVDGRMALSVTWDEPPSAESSSLADLHATARVCAAGAGLDGPQGTCVAADGSLAPPRTFDVDGTVDPSVTDDTHTEHVLVLDGQLGLVGDATIEWTDAHSSTITETTGGYCESY